MACLRIFALACLFSSTGCVSQVDFDPVGSDATVEGSWTLGGAAPTVDLCAGRSITHVRVRFFEGEAAFRDHPDLVFACELGAFDTRPTAVLMGGLWTMRMLALNNGALPGEDVVVAMGPEVMSDTATGHVVLPPADF